VAGAGGERTNRRRTKRSSRPSTPHELGLALQRARAQKGVGLSELHDRTGVPWSQLEALEQGDLRRFPDERTASSALRRYAEVVDLDDGRLEGLVHENWEAGLVDATTSHSGVGWSSKSSTATPTVTGHLSRYPGDKSHLEAFTQTAQTRAVPGGRAMEPGSHRDGMLTGAYPAVPPLRIKPAKRKPPILLRMTVWLTILLIAVGLAGLALHRWRPQVLKDIHLMTGPPAPKAAAPHHSQHPGPPLVTSSSNGPNSEQMTVRARNYEVVVRALQPAWIQVTTPASFTPVFARTLAGGEQQVFQSANGLISVQFGGAQALSAVQINGQPVPSSLFKPPVVPFTLNFSSAT